MNAKPCTNSLPSEFPVADIQDIPSSQNYHISLSITRKLASMFILRSQELNIKKSPDYFK